MLIEDKKSTRPKGGLPNRFVYQLDNNHKKRRMYSTSCVFCGYLGLVNSRGFTINVPKGIPGILGESFPLFS